VHVGRALEVLSLALDLGQSVEAVELLVDSLQPGVVQLLDALGPLVVCRLIFLLFILGRLVAHGTSVTLIVTSISIFLQHLLL